MITRPFTRSLDIEDYKFLPQAAWLAAFVESMAREGVPYRGWHQHRLWEYASILQQLEWLQVPCDVELVDVGAGASFFDPYLAFAYPKLCCTDGMMTSEDLVGMASAQRNHYRVPMPLYNIMMEDMGPRPAIGWCGTSDKFDVTMCISAIEHVNYHDAAFRELIRITKPGGYIFVTSDYFRDPEQLQASPWKHAQLTPYTREFVLDLPQRFPVRFVSQDKNREHDLDYRGDFVHNYSFVNICLQKI